MLSLVLLVALISGASPTAGPTPSPSPAALQVIAHTVSTSATCSAILSHANNAITAAIDGDATLSTTIRSLHATKLSGNVIERRNSLTALGNLAVTLDESAVSGTAEVKRLRDLAYASTDPDRKKDLKAFADALGGVLWRQHKVARDLNGFLDAMDAKDMDTPDADQQNLEVGLFGPTPSPNPFAPPVGPPPDPRENRIDPPTDDSAAGNAADDFLSRIPLIMKDERTANALIPAALTGC